MRRTRYDVFSDLIETIRRDGKCTLTRASYGARIPVDRAKRFIFYLLSKGILKKEEIDGSRVFSVTIRGIEYLEMHARMKKLLGEPLRER